MAQESWPPSPSAATRPRGPPGGRRLPDQSQAHLASDLSDAAPWGPENDDPLTPSPSIHSIDAFGETARQPGRWQEARPSGLCCSVVSARLLEAE